MPPKPSFRRRIAALPRAISSAPRRRGAHSPEFEERLIWIFGSPRSGSSWLLKVLAEHEAVVPVDEPLIGWYLGPFLCDLPGGDALALDSSTFTLRRVQSEKYSSFFSEQFATTWAPGLARMMRERFYAEALRSGGGIPISERRIVIKEPNGSQSADLITRVLPRAKLLFLLRDGRDVVDSELAANLHGSWVSREFPGLRGVDEGNRLAFVTQSAKKWLWRTEVVQGAVAANGQTSHVVRYEDLLHETEKYLKQIFDWLGLEANVAAIAGWIETNRFERMAGGSTGPREFFRLARPGSWRENLSGDEKAVIAELLGPKLRELGYED